MKLTLKLLILLLLSACGTPQEDNPIQSSTPSQNTGDEDNNSSTQTCPTNYIKISSNTDTGITNDFCVMKYEAKVENGKAVSKPEGYSSHSVDLATAQTYCKANGTNYDLISNDHWITIAREIEQKDANWSNGIAYSGYLARGFSASTASGDPWSNGAGLFAQNANDGCEYNTSNGACGSTGNFKYKRTLQVKSGEVIWDFAGNHYEWVDWDTGGAANRWTPTCTDLSVAKIEVKDFSCGSITDDQYLPQIAITSPPLTLTSTDGIGIMYLPSNTVKGAAIRGGDKSSGDDAGIYAINFNLYEASTTNIGFRCVYNF